jgi:hypothetical protein
VNGGSGDAVSSGKEVSENMEAEVGRHGHLLLTLVLGLGSQASQVSM